MDPRVVLYIPTRAGYNGLILMNTVLENGAWTLTPDPQTSLQLTVYKPQLPEHGIYLEKFIVRNCDGILLNKVIRSHPDIVVTDAAGQQIKVISMAQHTTVFGSHKLHKNFTCFIGEPQPVQPVQVPQPVQPQYTQLPPNPPSPKLKKKLPTGGLNHYVAKQLFELAILRKELCPIVAEEFIAGNTAVMPCGHLFMQIAIEESFKKEANKCPWCRQMGTPTFV